MTASTADAKRAMRREIRAQVADLGAWTRARRAERAGRLAERAPPFAHAGLVLAYRAMADEIDATPLVARLRARGVRVAFPHVDARGRLHLLLPLKGGKEGGKEGGEEGGSCWTRDRHGIEALDPMAPGVVRVAARDLDAVIVPGRAFDAAGGRLGRGKGFYDGLLSRLRPDARGSTVGLAFAAQLVTAVPREAHDRAVAWVATEDGVRRARPSCDG
jgi:5-formyltetrahydrofolate cyclo-ligase